MSKKVEKKEEKKLFEGQLNCVLLLQENEEGFLNLFISTNSCNKIWIRLGKYNSKLLYKLRKECEGK